MTASKKTLAVAEESPGVLAVTMTRPESRNAFNAELIRELHEVFTTRARAESVRVVVLRGEGPSFSAGADLNWMRSSAALGYEENLADARRMADMFENIAQCPAPVVAVVQGHALGGGSGLAGAADVAFAAEDAKFGFTEARLGIIPAVISPFVLRKIGQTHARRYFTSAEIFDGKEAERIGLVQKAVPAGDLDALVGAYVKSVVAAGPQAVRDAKKLIREVSPLADLRAAAEITAPWIARLRTSTEGQEGMAAFFEKRPPAWTVRGRRDD